MDKKYCPYCMSQISEGQKCPVCGLADGSYEPLSYHIPPGTVLKGRYMVGRVLGEGGFGITYIGCDLQLEMKVAIKEYYPKDRVQRNAASSLNVNAYGGDLAKSYEKGKHKFLEEARVMARLTKEPSIVRVQDFFEINNTAYIVMEYIEGTTLSELVKQKGGKIPPEELLPLVEPLFKAMQTMHEIGLLHRDISPDNIMIENGNVRLLDFGCAREAVNKNETMTIQLKYGYAPIEQYQQSGQGPWTDVYAFSATLYFCLTGRKPPGALDRVASDDLLRPTKLGVALTEAQEKALLRGLRIQQNRRTQSMEELHAELYSKVPPVGEYDVGTVVITAEPSDGGETPDLYVRIAVAGKKVDPYGMYGDVCFDEGIAKAIIHSGRRLEITGLPAGTAYEVTVDAPRDYTVTGERTEGRVEKNVSKRVNFLCKSNLPVKKPVIPDDAGGIDVSDPFGGRWTGVIRINPDTPETQYPAAPEVPKKPSKQSKPPKASKKDGRKKEKERLRAPSPEEPVSEVIASDAVSVPATEIAPTDGEVSGSVTTVTQAVPATQTGVQTQEKLPEKLSEEDIKKPGKKKRTGLIAAVITVIIIAALAGAAVFMLAGKSELPDDATVLFEMPFEFGSADAQGMSRFHLINHGTDEMGSFLGQVSTENAYIFIEFSKPHRSVTVGFETDNPNISDRVRVVMSKYGSKSFTANAPSLLNEVYKTQMRDFDIDLFINGDFDSPLVKGTLYIITTSEKMNAPSATAIIKSDRSDSESDNAQPGYSAEPGFNAVPDGRMIVQLYVQNGVNWSWQALASDGTAELGKTFRRDYHIDGHVIQDNLSVVANEDPNAEIRFGMNVLVPQEYFVFPDGNTEEGSTSYRVHVNFTFEDIVLSAEGYDDVVIPGDTVDCNISGTVRDWGIDNAYYYIPFSTRIMGDLGLDPAAFINEYCPAFTQASVAITLNVIEVEDPNFVQTENTETFIPWVKLSAFVQNGYDWSGEPASTDIESYVTMGDVMAYNIHLDADRIYKNLAQVTLHGSDQCHGFFGIKLEITPECFTFPEGANVGDASNFAHVSMTFSDIALSADGYEDVIIPGMTFDEYFRSKLETWGAGESYHVIQFADDVMQQLDLTFYDFVNSYCPNLKFAHFRCTLNSFEMTDQRGEPQYEWKEDAREISRGSFDITGTDEYGWDIAALAEYDPRLEGVVGDDCLIEFACIGNWIWVDGNHPNAVHFQINNISHVIVDLKTCDNLYVVNKARKDWQQTVFWRILKYE